MEIIGHRGASYDAPENTLASINLAWKQGADAVEIDVFLSKDGRIVAIHDETTRRYGGPDRKVCDQTLDELKVIDVGRWKDAAFAGERIPTLAEVIATIPAGKRLFVEIKSSAELISELKRELRESNLQPSQIAVIGLSFETMTAVKQELPQHEAYWVVKVKRAKQIGPWRPDIDDLIEATRSAGLDGLDVGNAPAAIDADYVRRVKSAGLGLYVWTVNDLRDAVRMQEAGVDGIATDRPGWMRERLAVE